MKPAWGDDICKAFEAAFRQAFGPERARLFRVGPFERSYRIWHARDLKHADHSPRAMMNMIRRLKARQ